MAIWVVIKAISSNEARKEASLYIRSVDTSQIESSDEMIIELAKRIHQDFQKMSPSGSPYLLAQPYVTDKRLPPIARLEDGVIEMYIKAGTPNNAALMLHYVLRRAAMYSRPLYITTEQGQHVVLSVTLPNGREALVDPYLGFAAYDHLTDQLLSPEDTINTIKHSEDFKRILYSLSEDDKPDHLKMQAIEFYKNIKLDIVK